MSKKKDDNAYNKAKTKFQQDNAKRAFTMKRLMLRLEKEDAHRQAEQLAKAQYQEENA